MQPQVARCSVLDAGYRTLTVDRTAVATRPLMLWLAQCLRGAPSAPCGRCGKNRRKAPCQHTLRQIQPQVARSSAVEASNGTLTVHITAVATRPLALQLVQCLRGALLGSVWLLRRNRRKAPRECNPHQIQPQVARSSALGAEYGTPIVLGTAIATRPPVLWLPEYIRGALLGSCG
jgi:hypothetical protein